MSQIAVNLLWCVPGDVGGSEQYLVRQLCGLAARANAHSHEITMYVLPGLIESHPAFGRRRAGRYRPDRRQVAASSGRHRTHVAGMARSSG